MKKVLLILLLFWGSNFVLANPNEYDVIFNDCQAVYTPSKDSWSVGEIAEDGIVLTKELIEGSGSYSKYNYSDGKLAFALPTDSEIIKDGRLIVVDNNLLKFSEVIYNGEIFEQVPINKEDVRRLFPEIEIFEISKIDNDNKVWLHKPLLKKRTILLYNDTDKFFHGISTKSKNTQNTDIRSIITFSRYGIFRFKHYGEHNGKLIFYIR